MGLLDGSDHVGREPWCSMGPRRVLILSVPGAHVHAGNPRITLGRTRVYKPIPAMTTSYDKPIKLVTTFNTSIETLSISSLTL